MSIIDIYVVMTSMHFPDDSDKHKILPMIHFAQMLQQVGQDRKPSVHHLLYSVISLVTIHPPEDNEGGLQTIVNFVSPQTCCCKIISLFLNYIDQTCITMLQTKLCDICLSNVVCIHFYFNQYISF